MDTTTINVVAAVASALAAFSSVFVAVFVWWRTERLGAEERRRASFEAVAEWQRDIRAWAADTIDVLSEATYVCGEMDGSGFDDPDRLFVFRCRISALIDRGRFFLPNLHQDGYGADKPFAYRGYRHSGLDPLVAAEKVLSTGETGAFSDRKHALVAMKREFVSAIQRILDPERHNRAVGRLIREGHDSVGSDQSLGGLLSDDTIPRGADRLLANPSSAHVGLRNRSSNP